MKLKLFFLLIMLLKTHMMGGLHIFNVDTVQMDQNGSEINYSTLALTSY